MEKQALLSSIVNNTQDRRPYAEVSVLGKQVLGLMDTGASVSCVGGTLAADLVKDHSKQPIVGRITICISFRGESKPFRLWIVPTLSENLYLGIDFWSSFNLLPDFVANQSLPAKVARVASLGLNDQAQVTLTPHQKIQLAAVIKLLPSFAEKGLGKTTLIEHEIDTGSAKPIKQRHYAVSPAIEQLMYTELDRMLSLGVIEESDGPWSSPVVLVRKPGKVRLCVDCRKLNEVTVKNAYPMPLIEGILSRLPRAEFISSIDLKDAYWQIPLEESARDKTAFTVPGRPLYRFTIMPYGPANAPQTMCKLMDKVIPPSLRNEISTTC